MKSNYTTPPRLDFDPSSNVLYILKCATDFGEKKNFLGKNGNKKEQYSNLLIWDIDNQEKYFLLDEQIASTHSIRNFYFEHHYNEKEQCIVFNKELTKINYSPLPQRALKQLLLIETMHLETQTIHLWYADKKGQHLALVAQLLKDYDWHLDMGNNVLRVLEHQKQDTNIREIPWEVPS